MSEAHSTQAGAFPLGFLRRAKPEEHPLDTVIKNYRKMYAKGSTALIEQAYVVAVREHQGQLRKSGEEYITHPVAVAEIIAEMGLPDTVIAAALLHDVVEDTGYPLSQMVAEFGDEVAMMVDGVTKLDKVQYGDAAQAETVRKMVVAMARDIRVLLLKLADRLHNARTWKYVSEQSAHKKAQETLEIYAPLAHRLGLNTIKWELEDLSFATLYPKIYTEIVEVVQERAPERDRYLQEVRAEVESDLKTMGIKAGISGRPKHYYSVYQKMIVRGRDLNEIYDLVGVRVLVGSVRDCYAVLGALHARYQPMPGRFKDYIAMPKFNLYQSLHTTVIGPSGRPVEFQIRTDEMHRRAEYGLAAHWRYKANAKAGEHQDDSAQGMAWLRQISDWQQETADPSEFLDSLRGEIAKAEVYVFTPRGRLLALPEGSTPVDFAYSVHTDVGHKTIGAKVNGRLVALSTPLENGATVEILTSSDEAAAPNRDWLEFVQSTRARNKIRHWFTHERREEAVDVGREMLARAMRRQHLPMQRLMTKEILKGIAHDMHVHTVDALYASIGEHKIQPLDVVKRMVDSVGGDEGADEDMTEAARPGVRRQTSRRGDPGVSVHGQTDIMVKLARCCTPVPGDSIEGFVTRGTGVSVHRSDCDNLAVLSAQPERIVEVTWTGGAATAFLVQIEVEALDRARLLSDVTHVLADFHVNILAANVSTTRDRVAMSNFTFEMADPSHLGAVLTAVRKLDGVYDARRVTGGKRVLG